MDELGLREPRQSRSQQTLARILASGTSLIAEQSYDDLTIAEIAERAEISVGGFYSRFENKEALFSTLQNRLAQETQDRLSAARKQDWSATGLYELLFFIVLGNAELYEKYRGVLTVVHLRTHGLGSPDDDRARSAYNQDIVTKLEALLLLKREEVQRRRPRVAIRTAIACMTSMLKDAIVFEETSLYPAPGDIRTIARRVAQMMYQYLVTETP